MSLVATLTLVLLLAVVEGFLKPDCQIVVQVFGSFDAQAVNDARVLFLRFLDATVFQSSAKHEGAAVVAPGVTGTPTSKNICSRPAGATEISIRAGLSLSFLKE